MGDREAEERGSRRAGETAVRARQLEGADEEVPDDSALGLVDEVGDALGRKIVEDVGADFVGGLLGDRGEDRGLALVT